MTCLNDTLKDLQAVQYQPRPLAFHGNDAVHVAHYET